MHSVIILYDSKILRIQCVCVSLLTGRFLVTLFILSTFHLQFSGVRASSQLSCEYVNCIIFQFLVVWLFKLWPSFGFSIMLNMCVLFYISECQNRAHY